MVPLHFGWSEPFPWGVWFGVRWGEHCRSSALSPQTSNVSAVIDVKSGHIVGSLKVGRYGGGAAQGFARPAPRAQLLLGRGWLGGASVLGSWGQR